MVLESYSLGFFYVLYVFNSIDLFSEKYLSHGIVLIL